ncbi:type III pantothenate kinase [Henriciella litoralis]|uniref:type III pantothenate kinase n=1 Tax=Henriciella litoralis TaxID=568102 RepID=UPI000A062A61|nr:type III pantothenate kinase [Henriciella litoralis]
MLLAIDVGNTNTVFALHDGEDWVAMWRSATDSRRTADDHIVWLGPLMDMRKVSVNDVSACVISCVVPQALFNFRNLARRYFAVEPLVVGEPDVELGVPIRIQRPEQVGADRLVAAIGAHIAYPGALIVIDSGTATTLDVVGPDGGFEGGIISPGINLSMRALHDAAAQLPRIAIQKPERIIGDSTVAAMQTGVFWGYIDLIDGLVRRVKEEYAQPMTVIATGGVASLFEGASATIDHYDQTLMESGLLEIYRRNKKALNGK